MYLNKYIKRWTGQQNLPYGLLAYLFSASLNHLYIGEKEELTTSHPAWNRQGWNSGAGCPLVHCFGVVRRLLWCLDRV